MIRLLKVAWPVLLVPAIPVMNPEAMLLSLTFMVPRDSHFWIIPTMILVAQAELALVYWVTGRVEVLVHETARHSGDGIFIKFLRYVISKQKEAIESEGRVRRMMRSGKALPTLIFFWIFVPFGRTPSTIGCRVLHWRVGFICLLICNVFHITLRAWTWRWLFSN